MHSFFDPPESKYQTASQSVQRFLHSSRQRVAILYNGPPLSPLKLPLPWESEPHLTHDSLGPSEPTNQTTSRSVQPSLQRWLQTVSIVYNGTPLPPTKLSLPIWGSGPPSNTWFPGPTRVPSQNGISISSAIFAGLSSVTDRQTDWPTDHATQSVTIGRIYIHSTAMQPNNINIIIINYY